MFQSQPVEIAQLHEIAGRFAQAHLAFAERQEARSCADRCLYMVRRRTLALAIVLVACTGDKLVTQKAGPGVDASTTTPESYPPGPYELKILGIVPPGMTFEGLSGSVSRGLA